MDKNAPQKGGGLSWLQPTPATPKAAESKNEPIKSPSAQRPAERAPAMVVGSAPVQNKKSLAMAFGAGTILGLLLGWPWFSLEKETASVPQGNATSTTSTPSQNTTGGSSATTPTPSAGGVMSTGTLTVPATQPAGPSVAVSAVSTTEPIWVTVYESRNGAPGNTLGAALFSSSQASGVVHLLRSTVAGQTYFVGKRRDDGDRTFSLKKDAVLLGSNGQPQLVSFRAE